MILEEATYEAFGYYPSVLKPQSVKPIIATCEFCGKFRVTTKNAYRCFCNSCGQILGEKSKGRKNPMFGMIGKKCPMFGRTGEKCPMFGKRGEGTPMFGRTGKKHPMFGMTGEKCPNFGRTGEKCPRWRGGKKLASARTSAKRKRQLGYTLLIPLKDGEEGHHVTNEYVIGIPKEAHQKLSGGSSRKKHRTKVLQWLKANDNKKYLKVLCILAQQ